MPPSAQVHLVAQSCCILNHVVLAILALYILLRRLLILPQAYGMGQKASGVAISASKSKSGILRNGSIYLHLGAR